MAASTYVGILKDAGVKFWEDKAPRLGAALAFYTALSIAPLLLLVIGIASLVYQAAEGALFNQLHGLFGPEGAKAVEEMVAKSSEPSQGVWATVVGIVMLIVGATGVFAQLQDALNTVWQVENAGAAPNDQGWLGMLWALVRDRFLSFSMICGMSFLLLVSLVFSAVLHAMQDWLLGDSPGTGVLMHAANLAFSFVLTTLLFALIFRFLPSATVAWSDVWIGAALTALLFAVGKFVIGLYLGNAAVGSAFGAAGSFVILLLWIYYSTQILLYGAEFTQVYASRLGSGLRVRGHEANVKPLGEKDGRVVGHLSGASRATTPIR